MSIYPKSLENLIESFKLLPGIGDKSAKRMAFKILELDKELVKDFSENLLNVKNKLRKCVKCGNYSELEKCEICNNKYRHTESICVVEQPKNLYVIEQAGLFDGTYHVLEGLISPMDGISPDDIKIKELFVRIKEENINEIIFALAPSIEAETTISYILKVNPYQNLKITKIAQGLPLGTDIDYVDNLTLEMAIKDRQEIHD